MEVAAGTAQSFVAIGQGQLGGDERLAFLQVIGRIILVDAGEEVVVLVVVRVDAQLVIAAVAERGTDDTSLVLTRLPVQRKHHFGMVGVRIARTVLVLDDLHARHKRFLHQATFVGPRAVQMAQPHFTATDRQIGGSKLVERDRLLLAVSDLGPRLDDIHIVIGAVAYIYIERIDFVLEADDGLRALVGSVGGDVLHGHLEGHVAIGVLHGQGGLGDARQAVHRIGGINATLSLEGLEVCIGQLLPVIEDSQLAPLGRRQQQRGLWGGHTHVLSEQSPGKEAQTGEGLYSFLQVHGFVCF